jgi:hypothetical protein
LATTDWRVTLQVVKDDDLTLEESTLCLREDSGAFGSLSAATVASDVDGWLRPLWKAVSPAGLVHYEKTIVRELGTDSPTTAEVISHENGTLTLGSGVLPLGCCPVISLHTALATRSGRGRFHTPNPGSSSFMAGPKAWTTSGALWTGLVAIKDALLAGHDATHDTVSHHYSCRVWSRKLNTSHDVNSIVVRTLPGYLRTRMTAP